MSVNLKSLIGKLNDTTRGALEAAAGLCLSRTHYDIEVEHFLIKLLDASGSDAVKIFHQFSVDTSRLQKELERSLDKLKSGNARTPAISPSVLKMLTEAWTTGSLDYGATQIRSGHVLLALLGNDELARIARDIGKELQKIQPELLRKDFLAIVEGIAGRHRRADAPRRRRRATARRAAGGREDAQPRSVHRRSYRQRAQGKDRSGAGARCRNPPGDRHSDAPPPEQSDSDGRSGRGKNRGGGRIRAADRSRRCSAAAEECDVRTLDLALLQAGAGIKGEFENRLKGLIEEVKSSPTPIILFIDEAHTMIGAGGQAGQNDAANLLKPALARGELRTIAATTWSEYKKYFEKDPALARRFQVVKVEEPDEQLHGDDARDCGFARKASQRADSG